MGKRSTSRRLAMQAVYQAEMAGIEVLESIENLFSNEEFIPETKEFARRLAESAWKNRAANDKIITDLAIDWPLERIGKVDRSILRLALQELKEAETPPSVVIDEAVEMAKKYSTLEAAKFINGILANALPT